MNTLVEVENLSFHYGRFEAVKNLSFTLTKGQILGFLGPNGAGKSTTMKMLAGALPPSKGSIKIAGLDMENQADVAKLKIGYLPEIPPLYGELTVKEYLLFCAGLHRLNKTQSLNALEEVLQTCSLQSVQNKLISQLSKGFGQRVGIAQALIHKPSVIILDEPTVGLDPVQIREIRQLIASLANNHAVIISTHILAEVSAICSDVLIINHGEVVCHKALDDSTEQKSWLLQSRQPIDVDKLNQLDSIEKSEELGDNMYRLSFKADQDSDQLLEFVTQHRYGLIQFKAEDNTLEQLFVQSVSQESGRHV